MDVLHTSIKFYLEEPQYKNSLKHLHLLVKCNFDSGFICAMNYTQCHGYGFVECYAHPLSLDPQFR